MDKQFKIYSLDTKAFYTEEERNLNNKKFKIKKQMQTIENWSIHNNVWNKEYIEFEDYKNKLERLDYLKKKEDLSSNDEVELIELKELFKKPRKSNKNKVKSKEYKTAQEQKLEKENKVKKKVRSDLKKAKEHLQDFDEYIKLKDQLKETEEKLRGEMTKSTVRNLNERALTEYNQITLFENALSRAMDIKPNEINLDMVVVRAYHYEVLRQLIENGFIYSKDGEEIKYRIFTASAGQIRTKKVLFIREDKWDEYEKTLMCGLTIEDINNSLEKGCNINKFLAYLALCNSATDPIENFNIDRAIVIDDFETEVYGEVDYIDNKTFEITRKFMNVPIPHSDGCGWILPSVNKKNFMVRLPWVKGLLTPVDYIKFCDEYRNGDYKITDIYGKEWDLKTDNIEYVFSKSQFKMWKYYPNEVNEDGEIIEYGWDKYVRYFKEFNCKANMCNLEPSTREFRKANFNYQMWQTLTDITDEEIKSFTDEVDDFITKGYSDRDTMLRLLGATEENPKKNYLQKCLEIYPELIRDYHVKEELASMLNARKKEAKYGKFKIDATYTFLIPDVYAWLQYIFLGDKQPKGLLGNKEVSCKLYRNEPKLLVERSPHLYREHAVRNNIVNDLTKKWFVTDGIYTSSHDLISKTLQFDNDGDKALVVSDKRLVPIAERNMKNIVPLYYEMGKAKPQTINNPNIYHSLIQAFKFNNIGKFSNQLTVMWDTEEPDLTTIAQITALNNFTIDGAKTLLVPEIPKDIQKNMKASNRKMPYFFQFAKDKDVDSVYGMTNGTVNRICRNIEAIKQDTYDFSSIGRFNKNYLMNNIKVQIDDRIINKYKELDNRRNETIALYKLIMDKESNLNISDIIANEFKKYCNEVGIAVVEAIDMIIKYTYVTNRNSRKGFLFDIFGDVIYNNLKNNITKPLGEYIMCQACGERVKLTTSNSPTKYCSKCAKKIKQEQINKLKREKRKNNGIKSNH